MPLVGSSPEDAARGGIHIGDVGGNIDFRALGDIVGGNKIVNINTTIQISVEAVTHRPLLLHSPYRGLERFEERDKDIFFGRDQLIKNLLAQLGGTNLLLVLGASGSGKSSVLRAGIVPTLSALLGKRFRSFTLVPDVNPFQSLQSSFHSAGFRQAQVQGLSKGLASGALKVIRAPRRNDAQWLIFVDQFEELFTVTKQRLRAPFIDTLLDVARSEDASTKLVLAMRADFLDRFGAIPDFAKKIEKNISIVPDMHHDELRLAIEQPAARHGVVFEPGLVEEIIKDVQGQAGSLPLLQFTLDLLWGEECRSNELASRNLSARTYRDLGGVRGALQKRADDIYNSFGDDSDARRTSKKQELMRRIFLRLVDVPGLGIDNSSWRPVHKRAAITDFKGRDDQTVLHDLIDRKLLVSNREGGKPTVEVAHEALFISWSKLKEWIEAAKQVIYVKNRLSDDARRWRERQQENSEAAKEDLLSGSRLSQALDMQSRQDFVTVTGPLTDEENDFLKASEAWRDQRRREEETHQRKELEAAQALAAEQRLRAEEQKRLAEERQRAVYAMQLYRAEELRESDPMRALELLEDQRRCPVERREFTYRLYHRLCDRAAGHLGERGSIFSARPAFSHDGRLLATGGKGYDSNGSGVVSIWDVDKAQHVGMPGYRDMGVRSVAFSVRDDIVGAGFSDGNVTFWSVSDRKQLASVKAHGKDVRCIQSIGSNNFLSCANDGSLVTWQISRFAIEVADRRTLQDWDEHDHDLYEISADGAILAAGGNHDRSPDICVWDLKTTLFKGGLQGHLKRVTGLSISSDGTMLVSAGHDTRAILWDLVNMRKLAVLRDHSGAYVDPYHLEERELYSSAFAPDQSCVAVGGIGFIQLYDVTALRQKLILRLPSVSSSLNSHVHKLTFSPDSEIVLSLNEADGLMIWKVNTKASRSLDLNVAEKEITSIAISPDGDSAVTGGNAVKLWNLNNGEEFGELAKDAVWSYAQMFSPDGSKLIIEGNGGLSIWNVVTREQIGCLGTRDARTLASVRFSPDGKYIASGESIGGKGHRYEEVWILDQAPRGRVTVVDADTCADLVTLDGHEYPVRTVAFSADGSLLASGEGFEYNGESVGGKVIVWEVGTWQQVTTLTGHDGSITALAFSCSNMLATADQAGSVYVWDMNKRKFVVSLEALSGAVSRLAFTPDGETLIALAGSGAIVAWKPLEGKAIDFLGHFGAVRCFGVSADGLTLATGGEDKTVRLWDVSTGDPLSTLTGNTAAVDLVAFRSLESLVSIVIGAPRSHCAQVRIWDTI